MADLRTALAALDPKNDKHWTEDGLPLMEAVGEGFTRKQVTSAFPNFTRKNPVLEDKPKEVEVPEPKQDAVKASVFGMPSSEFGGVSDEDDEEDEVDNGPTPEQLEALAADEAAAAAALEASKAELEAAKLKVEQAGKAHDVILEQKASVELPEHARQQASLMHFLQQQTKQKPVKSVIDQVMERKDGYGRKRPIFFPQGVKK